MHIFLNALGAACASGFTYVRNVIPHLSACPAVHTTVALNGKLKQELPELPNVSFLDATIPANAARRVCFEQTVLPGLVRRTGADVLIAAGNFALRNSPIPQILLSGNSLYTSRDFSHDLRSRRHYNLLFDHQVKSFFARRSVHWADAIVTPSRSFADDLQRWTRKPIINIYHGFDPDIFFADRSAIPSEIQQKIDSARDALRLLLVSHYNYYRNFETLINVIPILRARLGKKIRLFLTCKLDSEDNGFRPERAAALVRQLGIREEVVQLGAIPYRLLHNLYKACDIYVTPAYAETFAHPLVEAMACGLPVIASDLPVHREICGEAALYFHRFSPEDACAQILRITESPSLGRELSGRGRSRSIDFSWSQHVDQLLALAIKLVPARATRFQNRMASRDRDLGDHSPNKLERPVPTHG
jgi:glycosyltransferase involved in cell wall biosynthesis